jgi:hypothetical protein
MPLGDSPHYGPPRRPGARPTRLSRARPKPGAYAGAGGRQEPTPATAPPRRSTPPLAIFVRYVLPAVVVLAGVVAMAFGTDTALEGGAGLVSAGLAIWLVNWLFRLGATGDAERDAEDRARDYFDRHGRWPEGR